MDFSYIDSYFNIWLPIEVSPGELVQSKGLPFPIPGSLRFYILGVLFPCCVRKKELETFQEGGN